MWCDSKDVHVRDCILAMSASTDSQINRKVFGQTVDYAPTANFELLKTAYDVASEKDVHVKVGNVFTADLFTMNMRNMKNGHNMGF